MQSSGLLIAFLRLGELAAKPWQPWQALARFYQRPCKNSGSLNEAPPSAASAEHAGPGADAGAMPEPNLTTPPNCIQPMNEPTPVTLPTIHRNGTGAANLEAEYQAVRKAITATEELLQAATCNARDFYPQEPGAWERARDERAEAFRLLQLVSNYVEQWEVHAADAMRKQRIRNRERARTIAMGNAEARDRHRDHSRDSD